MGNCLRNQPSYNTVKVSKMKTTLVLCLILVSMMVMVMVTSVEGGKITDDLCEKCSYCKTDSSCDGCNKCSDCKDFTKYPCKFCRKKELESKCLERCTKGCGICEKLESCKES